MEYYRQQHEESHSLELSEEEQLQIALALSAEEQQGTGASDKDERLARQLQAVPPPQHAPAPGSGTRPQPGPSAGSSSRAGSSTDKMVDNLRVASVDAMQRLSSGSQVLWGRFKRMGEQPPAQPAEPYYQPPQQQQQAAQNQPYHPHAQQPYPAPTYTNPGSGMGYQQPQQPQQQQFQQQPQQPQQPQHPQHQYQQQQQYPQQQYPQYPQQPLQRPQHPQHPQHQQQPQQPAPASGRSQLSEDEALALALQQQFDLEEQQAWRTQQQQPQQPQQQRPVATGPLGAGAAAATAAAGGAAARPGSGSGPPAVPAVPRPPVPAAGPTGGGTSSAGLAPSSSRVPGPTPVPAAPAPVDRSRCAGCSGTLVGMFGGVKSAYITALGRHWHPGCLICGGCRKPIGSTSGVPFTERDGLLWHLPCFKEKFIPKCSVCHDFIPEQANRRILWNEVPFWKQRYCPSHEGVTPRCSGCDRLRPYGEDWAELEDGRQLCLCCLDTMTTDTRDAQPLWQSVLAFYSDLGLALPSVPPMMLVDSGALNEAEGQETHGRGRGGGPVFHVRGLTLTESYASIRSILRIPGGNPFAVQRESVQVGPTRTHVTGILVVYGLPRLLTGSILAHEVLHAYLRMGGCTELGEQVEEGLAQLMALLWLEAQAEKGFKDDYEERLAAYLGHQIRSDTSVIYGDGFRAALEAFQVHGLEKVLHHVRQTGTFPPF